MKKMLFWIGTSILAFGITVLSYTSLSIQSFWTSRPDPKHYAPDPREILQLDLWQKFQIIGLGISSLGIILMGYTIARVKLKNAQARALKGLDYPKL